MGTRFDYNEEEVMKILSDTTKTEDEKKAAFDSYKESLLSERKNEIINRLNECAKENPMITQEKYISMLKKYSNDDLSIPFDSIISDIDSFDSEMKAEYSKYLENERLKEVAPAVETPVVSEPTPTYEEPKVETPVVEETPVNIEITPNVEEDIVPDVTPFSNTVEANPFFDENQKEITPNDSDENQKGNANAIIISIITIVIGIVIMYSIIRLK